MGDLASHVVLQIKCPSCGLENDLTLEQVIMSQDAKQVCTCRSESECPAFYFADLLSRADIDELLATWLRLEQQARGLGAELRVQNGVV